MCPPLSLRTLTWFGDAVVALSNVISHCRPDDLPALEAEVRDGSRPKLARLTLLGVISAAGFNPQHLTDSFMPRLAGPWLAQGTKAADIIRAFETLRRLVYNRRVPNKDSLKSIIADLLSLRRFLMAVQEQLLRKAYATLGLRWTG